ncbi:dihydroneopterin aldolase [Mucilaginibacter roseus]|uniref:7,8-dihydroneopterin aldolase n=1 Tax=Mucilaginibacter roseus TaxID=1528868 RepID=A0ABS8TY29_9SPHI|nr:dihydroneopterin aldolase [Mucilaginibacter roseus]MCD8739781.1 dihydroneopterin aldolase [Mucilaginibacter roseus]
MITVCLNNAEFYAYHGFYHEEQLIGGRYLIDITVGFEPSSHAADDELSQTVDYQVLYAICKEEMATPRKLIETAADAIVKRVKDSYPYITQLNFSLKKLNPPLGGSVGYSAVNISYQAREGIN